MKNRFTFLILLLLTYTVALAQFSADDIVFWVGEGDKECYLAVDFRDGTTDPSFAWGLRYNEGDALTFQDFLLAVQAAEPKFTVDAAGGFLNDVIYNHHMGLSGDPDWWSTWSGDTSNAMEMNGGISEEVSEGHWFGLSYGFSPSPEHPTITYPAYGSLWFSEEEFDYAIGEGENYTVVVVDFVNEDGSEPDSFAWKVLFNGSITPKEALLAISVNDSKFEAYYEGDELVSIEYDQNQAAQWLTYQGTNLSDWQLAADEVHLSNGDWFGLARGEQYTRRPFTPVPAPENPVLGSSQLSSSSIKMYPNPLQDKLFITYEGNAFLSILDINGRQILDLPLNGEKYVDISALQKGIYLVKVVSDGNQHTQRIIKN